MGFVEQLLKHETERCRLMPTVEEKSVLQFVCAMLNGQGGWIVVGVQDDGQVLGVSNASEIVNNIQDAISQHISPPALVYVHEEQVGEKSIVLLTVVQGASRLYSYDRKIYVLVNGNIQVPNPDMMSSMMRNDDVKSVWEQQTLLRAEMDDLDETLIRRTQMSALKFSRIRGDMANDVEDFLSGLRLSNSGSLSNGAVALFGREVERLLPQCKVRIQAMFGGRMADKYDDVRTITGNLLTLPSQIRDYFQNTLPRVARFSGVMWERNDEYLYPMNVLDEMVINALIHRDYQDVFGEVFISIYPNKIVCKNPGEMDLTVLNRIKSETNVSVLRNPTMANVLYMNGLMEMVGRGTAMIKKGMMDMRYKAPQWQCHNGFTILTLYCEPLEINDRIKRFGLNHKLGYVFNRRKYQEELGIGEMTAKKDLKMMLDMGVVESLGKGRNTQYVYRNYTE